MRETKSGKTTWSLSFEFERSLLKVLNRKQLYWAHPSHHSVGYRFILFGSPPSPSRLFCCQSVPTKAETALSFGRTWKAKPNYKLSKHHSCPLLPFFNDADGLFSCTIIYLCKPQHQSSSNRFVSAFRSDLAAFIRRQRNLTEMSIQTYCLKTVVGNAKMSITKSRPPRPTHESLKYFSLP